eukprot:2166793-Heterocapsa_arctica.AAC.1
MSSALGTRKGRGTGPPASGIPGGPLSSTTSMASTAGSSSLGGKGIGSPEDEEADGGLATRGRLEAGP